MKRKLLVLLIAVLFFFISQSTTVLATSIIGPYTQVHCNNINVSFIESNLCEDENCSTLVRIEYGDQFFIDNSCRIFLYDDVYVLDIFGNLSDNATELLNQACDPEIIPVIDYIEENNLTKYSAVDYNDFYPYYPTGKNNKEIKQIDETWYLATSSYVPGSVTSSDITMELMYIIIIIISLLIITIVSIIVYRKWKNSQ